ncbi:MAG: hypothetical protein AAF417_15010 [Pseudomonadota bacterium]
MPATAGLRVQVKGTADAPLKSMIFGDPDPNFQLFLDGEGQIDPKVDQCPCGPPRWECIPYADDQVISTREGPTLVTAEGKRYPLAFAGVKVATRLIVTTMDQVFKLPEINQAPLLLGVVTAPGLVSSVGLVATPGDPEFPGTVAGSTGLHYGSLAGATVETHVAAGECLRYRKRGIVKVSSSNGVAVGFDGTGISIQVPNSRVTRFTVTIDLDTGVRERAVFRVYQCAAGVTSSQGYQTLPTFMR